MIILGFVYTSLSGLLLVKSAGWPSLQLQVRNRKYKHVNPYSRHCSAFILYYYLNLTNTNHMCTCALHSHANNSETHTHTHMHSMSVFIKVRYCMVWFVWFISRGPPGFLLVIYGHFKILHIKVYWAAHQFCWETCLRLNTCQMIFPILRTIRHSKELRTSSAIKQPPPPSVFSLS